MNYAIFRTEPIMTISDLAQIGSHNKREKKAYKSNPDINISLSDCNVDLIPLNEKYVKGFYNIVKDYRKEHDERMKTEREDRKKTFREMLDKSKSVVADELLFTATNEFFKDMGNDELMLWANTCMEFVYKDLGYTKEQVLHSVIHLDEKTPHIHCVVVPIVKKFDKRTSTERYSISKKQYIRDKIHLSELQDKYHKRLTDKGFDLERGIKNSDNKHINIKEYKKITRKLNLELNNKNNKLTHSMNELEKNLKDSKNVLFNKDYVKVKKDTFDSINKVIDDSKKVLDMQPKMQKIYDEINNYTRSYQSIEKENNYILKEVKYLRNRNEELELENNKLKYYIKEILRVIKKFFRKLLLIGNDITKEETVKEVKDYYDNNDFNKYDVKDIAKNTTKEDDLYKHVGIEKNRSYEKDDHEITL